MQSALYGSRERTSLSRLTMGFVAYEIATVNGQKAT